MPVDTDAEIRELRTMLRDLVALSAIPAAWVGREPPAVAAGLADALVELLQLDFAFVRLRDPSGAGAVDVTRGSAWKTFPEWLERHLATRGPLSGKEIIPDVDLDVDGGVASCSGVVVPIGVRAEGGVVAAACDRTDFPTQIDQLLLSLAANHAATAFQSARLIHERARAEEELREARNQLEKKVAERTAELTASRARVVAAGAEERRRVVRDLHDGAQQRLVLAVINLKLAVQELGSGDGQVEGLVGEALDHAEKANFELRELAHGILPGVLTSGGLHAGVEELAKRWALPVTVDVPSQRFSPAVEATAYFVVSEALTNAIKHSGAQAAEVGVNVEGSLLRVEVRDDGVGGAHPDKGSGLTGLRDRVEALGGTTEIASPAGVGTSVLAKIPIEG
jgi:signal transduction histidine kinase